jgi:hypothetical protein
MKYILSFLFFFIVKFYSAQNCNTYFTTYCGDDGSDDMRGITIDQQNNTYCIYQTNSASLATTPSAISPTFSGFYDAYITKFDSCGILLWATYLGTSGFESGEKIAMSPPPLMVILFLLVIQVQTAYLHLQLISQPIMAHMIVLLEKLVLLEI